MFQKLMLIFLFVILVNAILYVANLREKKVIESAEVYEKCIKAEYNTTPSAYYIEHNKYPTCY